MTTDPKLHTHLPATTSGDRRGSIDENAPVVGSAELEIDAPIETVWEVLTTLDGWPAWNPAVKSVSVDGPLAPGSTFRWKAGPGTISSTIEQLERPRVIAWRGKTLGIRAIHVWRLTQRGGQTFARTEESYAGRVARLLRGPLRKTLDKELADSIRHLKSEAERTARPTAGG